MTRVQVDARCPFCPHQLYPQASALTGLQWFSSDDLAAGDTAQTVAVVQGDAAAASTTWGCLYCTT